MRFWIIPKLMMETSLSRVLFSDLFTEKSVMVNSDLINFLKQIIIKYIH